MADLSTAANAVPTKFSLMFYYRPQGKVIFSQVSAHDRPGGYSVTADSCYGAVSAHPVGMLSSAFFFVLLLIFGNSGKISGWEPTLRKVTTLIGLSKGAAGTHAPSPPPAFFIQFHAVFEENGQNNNRFTPPSLGSAPHGKYRSVYKWWSRKRWLPNVAA